LNRKYLIKLIIEVAKKYKIIKTVIIKLNKYTEDKNKKKYKKVKVKSNLHLKKY